MKKDLISILKIDVRESEKGIFSLLSFNSFCTGLSTAFFIVATNSYFIKHLSVAQLPIAFIFSGLAGLFLVQLYKKLVNWKGLIFSYASMGILFAAICLLLFYLRLLGTTDPQIVFLTAYLGFVSTMPFVTVFALAFSSVSMQVFSLSQGKRLFALVGLSEIIANIVSYLIIPSLVSWWGGSEYFFLLSMTTRLISLIPLREINISKTNLHEKDNKSTDNVNFSLLAKDSYYLTMAVVTFCSVFAIFLVDYSYLLTVKFISVTNHIDTTILVSLIFCAVKLGELIASIYSARFNSSYGLKISLLILPILLVLSSALGFVTGLFMSSQILIITTFLLINKIVERAIRKGILAPSQKVLFQVAKTEERTKIQTLIDGYFSQFSTFMSGVLLFLCSSVFYFLSLYWYLYVLAIICFAFAICWYLTSQKLYQKYKLKIQQFLNQGLLSTQNQFNRSSIGDWLKHIPKKAKDTEPIHAIINQLDEINNQVLKNSKSFFIDQIKKNNVRYFKQAETSTDDELFNLCSKAFFHNDSFESRMSIICYSSHFTSSQKYEFLKENYRNINHHLQYALLVEILQVNNFAVSDPAERFYLSELCKECCDLILWAEISIDDLDQADAQDLCIALAEFRRFKVFHLFELLKLVYSATSISIIVDVWKKDSDSPENEAFAIELLENLVEGDLKKIVIPLLSDIPLNLKKMQLNELLSIHNLNLSERLVDIMLKNALQIDPCIKEMAAKLYVNTFADKSILKYYMDDFNVRLNSMSMGGKVAVDFQELSTHLRSKLYFNAESRHTCLEDFIFQSFFTVNNSQLGIIKKSKNYLLPKDQGHNSYVLKIQIVENEYLLSTYNLYFYLYLVNKY